MFEEMDMEMLRQSPYKIIRMNHHDATIHSDRTGHDWAIVSNYETPGCYLRHRHSARYPYHRQKGTFRNMKEALDYIDSHEDWSTTEH